MKNCQELCAPSCSELFTEGPQAIRECHSEGLIWVSSGRTSTMHHLLQAQEASCIGRTEEENYVGQAEATVGLLTGSQWQVL